VSVRWCHAIGEMLFLCSAKSRFFVPEYRSTCKEDGTLQKITCIASAEPRGPARRRQVAEAVGSSSQLTPRWSKGDSNCRSLSLECRLIFSEEKGFQVELGAHPMHAAEHQRRAEPAGSRSGLRRAGASPASFIAVARAWRMSARSSVKWLPR